MKLYYARHGQTDWNLRRRVQGLTDNPLNETGVQQARELAEKAALLEPIDVIVSSPLLRARQTAQILSERLRAPLVVHERLYECNLGSYEGTSFPTLEMFHTTLRADAQEFPKRVGATGESQLQLAHRVYGALEDIHARYANQTVFLVAHGWVCRMIETYFRSMTAQEFMTFSLDNCELRYGEI
ncbi:MAG: histidine phosphatase family protein [Oscillospiraceae bacterium]|jgi:probable phosphoglycerate mutase|nr:histidine phosphatase family protein [Oscillospiraceae bacterium]